MTERIIGIKPFQFVHIVDLNSNITRLETGPQTLILKTNDRCEAGPLPFVIVPPGQYCVLENPCKGYVPGEPVQLKYGQFDIRFHEEPFPLYPGEILRGASGSDYKPAIKPLPVIKTNHALLLKSRIDHKVGGVFHPAGQKWQVEGPLTYHPNPSDEIIGTVKPDIIKTGEAMRYCALEDCKDRLGKNRVTGEEWLVTKPGAYLPGVAEKLVCQETAWTLTPNKALHLQAIHNVENCLNKARQAGDEWLITVSDTESFMPPIGVKVVKEIEKVILDKGKYCVVLNPVNKDGKPQLGQREVRKGVSHFFLHPGESLEAGIVLADILGENEAIVLQAVIGFDDKDEAGKKIIRLPGERWMIHGPCEYIPSKEVQIVDRRRAIPLSKNEGIYVRDIKTGDVRVVMGPQAYLLTEHEELFKKKLSELVELLLKKGGGHGDENIRKIAYFEQSIDPIISKIGRDPTRVVAYRCPGNTACQVYNYKERTARVVFGPDLVILGQHEDFNVLSLSAGKPKKANALKSLCLMLGPDFITDIIEVETLDHARLRIQIAFNNHFSVDKSDPKSAAKIFAVPDFIGFACQHVASSIRGRVAQVTFDEFHRHSADVIQHAVFEKSTKGEEKDSLHFSANNLVISNVDIHSIEPVDVKMRDSLMQSVQMAIEIATRCVEATASHEAQRVEQEAQGKLERQKLSNECDTEIAKTELSQLQAEAAAVESTGQAVAEAMASSERMHIECESEIEIARLKAQASNIEHSAKLESLRKMRSSEISYRRAQKDLSVQREKQLSDIEVNNFKRMVNSLGTDVIKKIAAAGPEGEVQLLQSLGLSSVLLTDGNNPINLFTTAKGLVAKN